MSRVVRGVIVVILALFALVILIAMANVLIVVWPPTHMAPAQPPAVRST